MPRGVTLRALVLVLAESGLIIGAVGLAAYARFGEWMWVVMAEENGFLKALLIAFVCQTCLYYTDLYDFRKVGDHRDKFIRIAQALGAASFILAVIYFWSPSMMIGRGVFLIAAMLVISFIIGWRMGFDWLMQQVGPRERLLLVGTSIAAVKLAREIFERRQELGVEIVGFIDADPKKVGEHVLNPGVIGTLDDISSIVRTRAVDRVVVSLADARGKLPMDRLLEIKLEGVTFDHLASVYEEYTGKIAVENLRPSWLIFSSGFQGGRTLRSAKRAMDVLAAVMGLLLSAPLILLIAIMVRLTSRGPVLYHQARVGYRGRVFMVHKFRSMRVDAEADSGPVWAKSGDPRVTPIGRFLRKARLDELPQLWNVLVGEMSFVGPRPERPEFVEELTREIPFYGQRHVVRPGLTGWAQVRYSYGASREDALEKLQYELFYIKNLSLALDLFIILKTIKTVVLRRGT
ncbi:MAG TPA: TIGR03013 family XrtA/PEP-CTERM system glycosyltransferase [Vicinamibacterales bacterium]|nr:TIGR03013 family XrtA/PEP-CTERM system glycosyltransferase [Vicinamibacterales bacterium]